MINYFFSLGSYVTATSPCLNGGNYSFSFRAYRTWKQGKNGSHSITHSRKGIIIYDLLILSLRNNAVSFIFYVASNDICRL